MATLLSWLGKTDLDQMKLDKCASIATIALKGITLDSIVILASTWEDEWDDYKVWLEKKLSFEGRAKTSVIIQRVKLASPIDYLSITQVMQQQLNKASSNSEQIYLNLTSGTPAMTVVSVLLGKSIAKCQLLQTSPTGDLIKVEIPIDFATEYTKSSNVAIQSLASDNSNLNPAFETITAKSNIMQTVVKKAHRLALSDLPALILGESGSGKELMATAIHKTSNRSEKPFVAVNCGALPESLVDSILFGHVKGAFTGADNNHAGLFEQANHGTLFLDEVGELPLNVQVKLLRALQQNEITRVGDTKSKEVNVRVVAATHQNLFKMISEGAFREDLFYRLAVGVIEIPALRDRTEDIPILIETLIANINKQAEKHPLFNSKKISHDAIKFAQFYPWPGNIRELWNTLNRAVLWSESNTISAQDLQSSVLSTNENPSSTNTFSIPGDIQQHIDKIKEIAINSALEYSGKNKSKAAEALGLKSHQTLSSWMKKLGIEE
ncbi:putative transcriptional regulator [Vibrio halioticoli NBRC 102217]|uniref:Putative transcriptional regulator n=1 Tax=Vibrio halioticoli NBRC 102217 TaxID=1219072 RepID=V5FRZ7_9VIBR|nr:sigma 54-interacting transcriptional regulator [Vibrio halioticoli]GAD91367.1 putative transcriptional regulator [Vibrio halioticoli NBRC 102217]